MFKLIFYVLIVVLLLVMGCTPGDNFDDSNPAGFLFGLWHGIISFFTLIISIFSDTITMYEVNNTGVWYDFGYFIGLASIGGSVVFKRK